MNIRDLIIDQQRSLFVGREQELAILQNARSVPGWQLLHLYGPGGIGKTTLLRQFALTVDPDKLIYMDGHGGIRKPDDFLDKICAFLHEKDSSAAHPANDGAKIKGRGDVSAETADMLNRYASSRQEVVMLLDTFEQWGPIEQWLRDDWLPSLSPHVRIYTTGRFALEGKWLQGGWDLLVQNIELPSLSSAEVEQYAHLRGIHDRNVIVSLQRFSRGVPLALSMSCEIIAREGATGFLDVPRQKQMIGHLINVLTNHIRDRSLNQLLEAASVVWRFDQDVLQSLLEEHVSTERFREFCQLPFVTCQEESWSLHDSVRQWTFDDLRRRMPAAFKQYRKRALDLLRRRERDQPDKKAELAFEKLYLQENDFVRTFCFQWDDSLFLRECKEYELEQVERLYVQYLHNQSNYTPGEVHLEPLIRPLWSVNPGAFSGLWKEDRLVAFCSCIPFTDETAAIFRSNPITAPIAGLYDPGQRQCLICIAGVDPLLESEISGTVARAMAKIIDRKAMLFNVHSMPNWMPLLPVLGFERLPSADSATAHGVVYQAFQLDLRSDDITLKIDRMLASLVSDMPAAPQELKRDSPKLGLPLKEAVILVRRALKHYSQLPLLPNVVDTLRPLLPHQRDDLQAESVGRRLQAEIQQVLQKMANGTEEERLFHQIIHYAYIRKIGTHEIVAEYLNIAVPTYYRYLRIALRKLAYELILQAANE